MPTYADEGIVLRRVDYGEADRILTVLTRERGKIGVIARGVRKAGSRRASHVDLFARSKMQLATGRGELDVLTQAQAVGLSALSTDARRLACAGLCAELTDRVLESHHPDSAMYDLVCASIAECLGGSRDPRATVAWFGQRMIDRLGYGPQLHACVGCRQPLAETAASFSATGGGLLCAHCAPSDPGAIVCDVRTIKVLRCIAAADIDLYARLKLDGATLATLERVVEEELAHHLDRRLRSLDVLRALDRMPTGGEGP